MHGGMLEELVFRREQGARRDIRSQQEGKISVFRKNRRIQVCLVLDRSVGDTYCELTRTANLFPPALSGEGKLSGRPLLSAQWFHPQFKKAEDRVM